MMRYLLLLALVVSLVGIVMVPSAFAESIIKEKECEAIGKEINPMIECKIVLADGFYPRSASYDFRENTMYDDKNNILYLFLGGGISSEVSSWTLQGVDMNTFETTNDIITCEKITTGTYVEETTVTCTPEIEQEFDQTPRVDFEFLQKDGSTPVYNCRPDSSGSGPYPNHPYHAEFYDDELIFVWYKACSGGGMDHFKSHRIVGIFDYNGKHLGFLSTTYGSYPESFGKTSLAVSSSTDKKYIYFVTQQGWGSKTADAALYAKVVDYTKHKPADGWKPIHTDLSSWSIQQWDSHVFHNEESNKVYYFVKHQDPPQENILYVINGMGTKLTAEEVAAAEAAEAAAVEAAATEAAEKLEALQENLDELGATVESATTAAEVVTDKELAIGLVGLGVAVIVLGAFVLIGIPVIIIIVIVILIRRRRKTPKLTKQERDDYEDVKEIKRKRKDGSKRKKKQESKEVKPKEEDKKEETSAFCENCGNTLKPTAKFCGSCGTPVS